MSIFTSSSRINTTLFIQEEEKNIRPFHTERLYGIRSQLNFSPYINNTGRCRSTIDLVIKQYEAISKPSRAMV